MQVREKETDTGEFVEIARRSKEICDKVSAPLALPNGRMAVVSPLLTTVLRPAVD